MHFRYLDIRFNFFILSFDSSETHNFDFRKDSTENKKNENKKKQKQSRKDGLKSWSITSYIESERTR